MDNANKVTISVGGTPVGKLELEVGLENKSDTTEIYSTPPSEPETEFQFDAEKKLRTESKPVVDGEAKPYSELNPGPDDEDKSCPERDSEVRKDDSVLEKPETESDKPETESEKPETESDKPESESEKPETEPEKPETEAEKPECDCEKLEAGSTSERVSESDKKPEPEPEVISEVEVEMRSEPHAGDVVELVEGVVQEPSKPNSAGHSDYGSLNQTSKVADGAPNLEKGLQRRLTLHGSETDWPQIRLISAILFLGCIQMFVIGMSEWPYMQEVDKKATSTFFGYVGSVSALGHAIFAPLMGYWSSATGQTKNPMIAGRVIALVGCILYICLEMFPRDRRYVMLTCYTIFGISMSSVSVMRGYVAKVSTPLDRARAISMFGLATMLAVTVGPMFQMFFTTLSFPGVPIIPGKLWLNIYTGPIYVALAANIGSLILIVFFFKEKHFDRKPEGKGKALERRPSQAKAALTKDMRSFNMPLALTCIFIRMAATLTIVTINTTTSPLMMSVFGWANTKTVRIGSFTQACVGVISLLIFIGFATGRINKYISERKGAVISCVLFALFFLITYPWSFAGKPIRIKDAAMNVTGCNTAVYKWCADSLQVQPVVYLGAMVVVLGVAITLSTIAVDTLYSRILGNIDQGTMQGFFLFSLDIVNVLGPLVIAPMFTSSGQKRIWPIDGLVVGLATVACLLAYRKFPH